MFGTLFLEDALNALDGKALIVEQMTYALEELNVIGPIKATTATPLKRLDLRETRFPETQHKQR